MTIQNILFATDFSDCAGLAEKRAIALATDFGAHLHVFHALEVPLPISEPYTIAIPDQFLGEAREDARKKLAALVERATAAGVEATSCLGRVPAPFAVQERAKEVDADLVVVGTEGHTGLKHLLLGSVAEGVVRTAPCSVLTVRAGEQGPHDPIVVGTDFSEPSEPAVAFACELARRAKAPLHLVHAARTIAPMVGPYEVVGAIDLSEAVIANATEKIEALANQCDTGGPITTEVTTASAHHALSFVAEKQAAQLIVVGSRGLTGLKHWALGSVAERTIRHAPCDVWTVRDKG